MLRTICFPDMREKVQDIPNLLDVFYRGLPVGDKVGEDLLRDLLHFSFSYTLIYICRRRKLGESSEQAWIMEAQDSVVNVRGRNLPLLGRLTRRICRSVECSLERHSTTFTMSSSSRAFFFTALSG